MKLDYIPTPVFLGDTFGSTVSVMLFPDDLEKARNWHAKSLSRGALDKYLDAGHSFDDRWPAFLCAIREADVSDREVRKRVRGAGFAADAMKALWAMVCENRETASWNRAIDEVCLASARETGGSPSYVRSQLKLFAPVLHLWLALRLSDDPCPREAQLFLDGYAVLFDLRAWSASRNSSGWKAEGYLAIQEYGPWPKLARFMESLGGNWQKRILLESRSSNNSGEGARGKP